MQLPTLTLIALAALATATPVAQKPEFWSANPDYSFYNKYCEGVYADQNRCIVTYQNSSVFIPCKGTTATLFACDGGCKWDCPDGKGPTCTASCDNPRPHYDEWTD